MLALPFLLPHIHTTKESKVQLANQTMAAYFDGGGLAGSASPIQVQVKDIITHHERTR